MIIPRGFEDGELTGTPLVTAVVVVAMVVAYFMAPSSNVIDDVSSISQDALLTYWARHPELSFPADCDWLADVDLMEEYADQARGELVGKTHAEGGPKGSQDALNALCADANAAFSQRGWRRYAVTGGDRPGTNWLTHVFIHDTWLMLILHAALLFLMGAPLLEQTWGHVAFAGFLVVAMLWAALIYTMFGTTGELMHGGSPVVAFVIGAFVARFRQRRVVFETHFGGTKNRFDAPAWSYIGYFAAKEAFGAFFAETDQRMFVDFFCLGLGAAVGVWLHASGLEKKLPGADPPEPMPDAVPGAVAVAGGGGVSTMTLHTPVGFAEPSDAPRTVWNWERPAKRGKNEEPEAAAPAMHWQSNEDLRQTRASGGDDIASRPTEDDLDVGGLLAADVAGSGTSMDLSVEAMIADLLPSDSEAWAEESIRGAPAEEPAPEQPPEPAEEPRRPAALRATDIAPVRPATAKEERPARPLRQTDREWQTPVVEGESVTPTAVLKGSPVRATTEAAKPALADAVADPVAVDERTQHYAEAPVLATPAPIPPAPKPRPRGRRRDDRDPTIGETQPEASADDAASADPIDNEPTQLLDQPPVQLAGRAGPRAAVDPRAVRRATKKTDPGTATPSPAAPAPSPTPAADATRAILHCRVVGRDKSKWMLETADGTEFDVRVADVVAITVGMVQLYRPPGASARSALLTDLRVRSGEGAQRHFRIPVEAFAFDRLAPGADRRTAWQRLVRELADASGCVQLPVSNVWPGPPFDGFRDEAHFGAVSEPHA